MAAMMHHIPVGGAEMGYFRENASKAHTGSTTDHYVLEIIRLLLTEHIGAPAYLTQHKLVYKDPMPVPAEDCFNLVRPYAHWIQTVTAEVLFTSPKAPTVQHREGVMPSYPEARITCTLTRSELAPWEIFRMEVQIDRWRENSSTDFRRNFYVSYGYLGSRPNDQASDELQALAKLLYDRRPRVDT